MLMRKLLCNGGSIDYMVTARTTYGATSIPIGLGINRYYIDSLTAKKTNRRENKNKNNS